MKLYYAPNTCAVASHIALEEAGASYETQRLDFSRSEQRSDEYLRVNPKGRVPALVTDQGIITETPAILTYVAQTYPASRLAPLDDNYAFAKMQEFNAYLCATVHVAHAHRLRGVRWSDDPGVIEALKLKVHFNMAECFHLIETELFQGPWVLGEQYSVSDMYLFTVSQWLEGDSVAIADFPRVAEMAQRMLTKAAVQTVLAANTN